MKLLPQQSSLRAPSPVDRSWVVDACLRIPPFFDLRDQVAVNPFLGFAGRSFSNALADIERLFHVDILPSAAELCASLRRGEFRPEHVEAAIAESSTNSHELGPGDVITELKRRAAITVTAGARMLTTLDQLTARGAVERDDLSAGLTRLLATRHDQGVARITGHGKSSSLFDAYRSFARHDRTPEVSGFWGFRSLVNELPGDPWQVVERVFATELADLVDRELYCSRLLVRLMGYAGLERARTFMRGPAAIGELVDLLAILLFHDSAARALRPGAPLPTAEEEAAGYREDRWIRAIGLRARELAYAQSLLRGLRKPIAPSLRAGLSTAPRRPHVQALFCIDVRSERVRRGLERHGLLETLGFAGFFGLPLALVTAHGQRPHCPPLLTPAAHLDSPSKHRGAWAGAQERLRRSGLSTLSYVEAWGVAALVELLRDGLVGQADPRVREGESLPLQLERLDLETRASWAYSLLINSGMSFPLSRLVVFFGHSSHVTNNPQAASLACGACAGKSGALNARTAAQLFADAEVRRELCARGLEIGDDVVFVAGLHDTMTDELLLLDTDHVPASHRSDLLRLRQQLAAASAWAREHRGFTDEVSPHPRQRQVLERQARDPAEVQPEWGLAGNACFVIGRRELTKETDLRGRAFLHNYDASRDPDGSILTMILTAPAIVASWISYQYYASTVAPRVFSSGRKTLHNVVGGFGVSEGGEGDIGVGLAEESLFRDGKAVHQLLRLQLVVEAEAHVVQRILETQPSIGDLVRGGWIGLHLVHPTSGRTTSYRPEAGFEDPQELGCTS